MIVERRGRHDFEESGDGLVMSNLVECARRLDKSRSLKKLEQNKS